MSSLFETVSFDTEAIVAPIQIILVAIASSFGGIFGITIIAPPVPAIPTPSIATLLKKDGVFAQILFQISFMLLCLIVNTSN